MVDYQEYALNEGIVFLMDELSSEAISIKKTLPSMMEKADGSFNLAFDYERRLRCVTLELADQWEVFDAMSSPALEFSPRPRVKDRD